MTKELTNEDWREINGENFFRNIYLIKRRGYNRGTKNEVWR